MAHVREAQTRLRTWVDDSYDQSEEISALIATVPDPLEEGILLLDALADEVPSKDEMRSLMHAPIPGVLKKVQGLLTRLSVVKRGALPVNSDLEDLPMYVPCALKDKDLFAMLSHLFLPGMMLSLRPAAMVAILAHLSGSPVLQPRAQRFLESLTGRWIPPIEKVEDFFVPEYPEIVNAEFIRLVSRVPEFLTDEERKLYSHLRAITRVRQAAPLRLEVEVGFTPKIEEFVPDVKLHCVRCGQNRSFTLMIDGTCGRCWTGGDATHEEPATDRSHMAECRSCKALYAVVATEDLKCRPKCHYCRNRQRAVVARCELCGNKFCDPSRIMANLTRFVCSTCSARGERCSPVREVPLAELIEENPSLMRHLGFEEGARSLIFDRLSLFKTWTQHRDKLNMVGEAPEIGELTWQGKPVMNARQVVKAMVERVRHGSLTGTCNLCFTERALPALQSACGQCSNTACAECLRSWYGRLAPGRLYVPSEGLCPFCKRTPKVKTLKAFNRLACRLSGRRSLQLDAGTYYGWCGSCFKIKEAAPRDCAQEAPDLQNFECEDCRVEHIARAAEKDKNLLQRLTKPCPNCHAPTIKFGGCNHITCGECSSHWCWQCGGHFSVHDIYRHMDEEHGTIGLEGGDGFDFRDDAR